FLKILPQAGKKNENGKYISNKYPILIIRRCVQMFEYGKEIPLDGAAVKQGVQPGNMDEKEISEGAVFSFDHRMDIPLDGVK
ncbi:MAG: hypothetical protein AB2401_14430, partial [Bacillus sp. (in: firmicutes)]